MKKRFTYYLFLFLFPFITFSQSIEEIRESKSFIYGLGESHSYVKADKNALNDLISQISVNVESSFKYIQKDSNFVYTEYAKSVINTYSATTLTNTLRIEEENNGSYKVIRYIPKTDIDKIFEKRKKAILEYTKAGIRAEWKFQIGDALRNYYWAYILLRSHPEYDEIKSFQEGDSVLLNNFLPDRINEIFSNIKLKIIEQNYKPDEKYAQYTIGLEFKENVIQNLEYKYKNDNSWSGTISANNGLAFLEYYGNDAKKDKNVNIRVEYMYADKAYFDKDVQSVFSSDLDLPYFSRCEINSQFSRPENKKTKSGIILVNNNNYEFNFEDKLNNIIKLIENKNESIETSLFTPNGLAVFNKLIKYGNAKLLKQNNELKIVKLNDEYIIRSLPMQFSFSKNRSFIEDVVLILNHEGKIDNINFSLSQVAIKDILDKDERFATYDEKFFLIRFMENYKTAYCLQRIDYLQKIFDQDALIIVGNILKKRNGNDQSFFSNLSNDEVEYQRLSKTEYIDRLKGVFAQNEFVNIHFEDNIVNKAKKNTSIYGIQIAQHYTSSRYADKGYLFLMVDLRDTLNPVVHVRTWQPQKNEDGSIYGLSDFPFDTL